MKQMQHVSLVTKISSMVVSWINNTIIGFQMLLESMIDMGSHNSPAQDNLHGSPAEYTGLILDNDGKIRGMDTDLIPCPWCGQLPCDLSEVTEPEELDRYNINGVYPVACCNPDCPVQPHADNLSWNSRITPKYIVEEMTAVLSGYKMNEDDVMVVPASYLQQAGMSEEWLQEKGIKSIVFPGDILLKPAIIKTAGYYRY